MTYEELQAENRRLRARIHELEQNPQNIVLGPDAFLQSFLFKRKSCLILYGRSKQIPMKSLRLTFLIMLSALLGCFSMKSAPKGRLVYCSIEFV